MNLGRLNAEKESFENGPCVIILLQIILKFTYIRVKCTWIAGFQIKLNNPTNWVKYIINYTASYENMH